MRALLGCWLAVADAATRGNFKNQQRVTKVPGIDTRKIEAAKKHLEF
jgi:hypothetical protein